jgi:hypothetical protein
MPDPDFRALCEELTGRLQHAITSANADSCYGENRDAVDRARAALAQPEPVAPTDEELLRLYGVATPCYHVEEYRRELDFARAALNRLAELEAQQ